jgi:serine/threonine protein kinase
VTKQGIKLLDFGLAKQRGLLQETDATLTETLTRQGQIVGTLQYMAPDQLQGKEADARSDLFAFGCVLYEMLMGKRAFGGESAASVIAAILEREPAALTAAPPLERIVGQCLAKDPDRRFQNAHNVSIALTWALEKQVLDKPGGLSHWPSIAAAVLILGVLAGWALHPSQPPENDRAYSLQINPPEDGQFLWGIAIGGVALSPDGRTGAFVASAGARNGLWVRRLDSNTQRLIPGTEGAAFPFWSPDNKSIAYFTSGKLLKVDLAGGTPLLICDVTGGRGGAWTSDAKYSSERWREALVPYARQTNRPLQPRPVAYDQCVEQPAGLILCAFSLRPFCCEILAHFMAVA